ncbi:RhoGAP domain-containing protein [Reticulomyxa filosa]|uniref:RhoGAP domain-containing protein n=1 Tax=Reticulomyxa filosa TaxID=46433 RepID=X6NDV5_RETFI|nr:RhoGAP domain-containing protein [Reticulomyxa filosa]|eukprot:ETO23527.1 RhoGAP domain-containing protein [Reticulomyxa filosa]
MLKEWLRGLNDSLIPGTHYNICVAMAKERQKLDHETLDVFLSQLPGHNLSHMFFKYFLLQTLRVVLKLIKSIIRYLVSFLKKFLNPQYVEATKMNLENISIVFAPTILKCPVDDPTLLMQNSKFEKDFVQQLITNLAV